MSDALRHVPKIGWYVRLRARQQEMEKTVYGHALSIPELTAYLHYGGSKSKDTSRGNSSDLYARLRERHKATNNRIQNDCPLYADYLVSDHIHNFLGTTAFHWYRKTERDREIDSKYWLFPIVHRRLTSDKKAESVPPFLFAFKTLFSILPFIVIYNIFLWKSS